MEIKKNKITLRKGAIITLYYDTNDDAQAITTDIDVIFDIDNLHSDDSIRQFYYKKPYPIYNGRGIYCIEWDINLRNELPVYG